MNSKQEPPNDEPLERTLRTWVMDQPLPPRFQEQVWQRIARAEAGPAPGLWSSLARVLELVLTRPRFAYAYIALLLTLGLGAGAWEAQKANSRLDATLGSQYVRALDPYQAAR